MHAIKNFYIFVSLVILMIVRLFASGQWMGSVTVAGLLVTWLDTIHQVWSQNNNIIATNKKKKYAGFLFTMAFIGLGQLILILLNLIIGLEWLNSPIILDEVTLLSLLTCLSQRTIVQWINKQINK